MEFLGLPDEVIDGMLRYLKWNDVLRFRRVCKRIKDITDSYLNIHPELAPEIEINEEDKNLREFLEMGIPTTKIFFNNISGTDFYLNTVGSGASAEFLERFGTLVTQLRIDQLSLHLNTKEHEFLECFVNLERLKASKYKSSGTGAGTDRLPQNNAQREESHQEYILPHVFKKLKTIIIENHEDTVFNQLRKFEKSLLSFCKEVKIVSLPLNWTRGRLPSSLDRFHSFQELLVLQEYIRGRGLCDGTENLQEFVFASHSGERNYPRNYLVEGLGSSLFLNLCAICIKFDVKLRNVGAYWFIRRRLNENPELCLPELGRVVLTLVNLHSCVFTLDMPNLEKIWISATSRSTVGDNWRRKRPNWESLKILEINVDSIYGEYLGIGHEGNDRSSTENLFKFFFQGVDRKALTELHLKFTRDAESGAIPKVEDIVSSCPNLSKLTLNNWQGTNKALTTLWRGLPGLKEISLEHCKNLGNVAFIGENSQLPVFLKLTRLRKLSLKGLDEMPNITDSLFSLVIRHLKLTHLSLTAEDAIKSVTFEGIGSLLTGNFAENIERFSFTDWSLENVTPEQFKRLERKFRSYYMI